MFFWANKRVIWMISWTGNYIIITVKLWIILKLPVEAANWNFIVHTEFVHNVVSLYFNQIYILPFYIGLPKQRRISHVSTSLNSASLVAAVSAQYIESNITSKTSQCNHTQLRKLPSGTHDHGFWKFFKKLTYYSDYIIQMLSDIIIAGLKRHKRL